MKQKLLNAPRRALRCLSLAVLCAITSLLPCVLEAQSGSVDETKVMTMTTSREIGESIRLVSLSWEDVRIEGVQEAYQPSAHDEDYKTYTLTSQTIRLVGSIYFLACEDNDLTSLELGQNPDLQQLYCSNNYQLENLDVTNNTALARLYCDFTGLQTIDVTQNTALNRFSCKGNDLTSLDLSQNTKLQRLFCASNQLTELDVRSLKALQWLDCQSNKELRVLDLSENKSLQRLYCNFGALSTLDLRNNTSLQRLWCHGNQLRELDLSQNTRLIDLIIHGNQISYKAMETLVAQLPTISPANNNRDGYFIVINGKDDKEGNRMSVASAMLAKSKGWFVRNINGWEDAEGGYDWRGVEFSGEDPDANKVITMTTEKQIGEKISLAHFFEANGPVRFEGVEEEYAPDRYYYTLTSQTVRMVGAIKRVFISGNKLTHLDVSQCPDLEDLKCSQNELTSLDLSKNVALKRLDCDQNKLTSLDVSGCPQLQTLYCWKNKLITLDVSQNPLLETLDCMNNELTKIIFPERTALDWLHCSFNPLKSLDLSDMSELKSLSCGDAQLTSLDVSKNSKLTNIDCSNNQLKALDVSHNPALRFLYCSYNKLTELDVSRNPNLCVLSVQVNQIRRAAMARLVAQLPIVSEEDRRYYERNFKVINTKWPTEGNRIDPAHVELAASKYWNAYDMNTDRPISQFDPSPARPYPGEIMHYAVTLAQTEGGTLAITGKGDSELASVEEDEVLSVEVTVREGYEFVALEVNGLDITATKQFTLTANTEVRATFRKKTYSVALPSVPNARLSVKGNPDLSAVAYGTELDLEVTPDTGYEVEAVRIDGNALSAPYRFTVTGTPTIEVRMRQKMYSVSLAPATGGSLRITGAADLTAVPHGTELRVEVTAAEGYELESLMAGSEDIKASGRFVVTANTEVRATFRKKTYSIELPSVPHARLSIKGNPDLSAVAYGTELELEVTPDTGYEVEAVRIDGDALSAPYRFTVMGTPTIEVRIRQKTALEAPETLTPRLYPNPATTYIIVEGAEVGERVRIYSLEGVLLREEEVTGRKQRIALGDLPRGIYLVRLGVEAYRLLLE